MRWFSGDADNGWLSRQFETEEHLQNAIALILNANGIAFNPEHKSKEGKSRADFLIGDPETKEAFLFLEAKVETKSAAFDRALGQALRNAVCDLFRTWVVIPDDVRVKEGHIRSLYAIGGEIVRISDLPKKLQGISAYNSSMRDFKFLNQWDASCEPISNSDALAARKLSRAPLPEISDRAWDIHFAKQREKREADCLETRRRGMWFSGCEKYDAIIAAERVKAVEAA